MFLTKQHFEESMRVTKAYKDFATEDEIKMAIAVEFAKELFENFTTMKKAEQEEVLSMILEDISVSLYSVN